MRRVLYVIALISMCIPVFGQTYTNRDDVGLGTPGWQAPCYYPSCNPGGVGTPTGVSQTFTNASPSLDGNSMKMTQMGTNYSNSMFHYSFGANNSATTFTGTYSVYIQTSLSPWQVFGMDMYDFIPGVRLMFGSQCAINGSTAGLWSFFDQGSGPNGTWHVSTVPCPILAPNTWYTISMTVHRVPGDTSCSGGVPAEHYDSITQNGTTYPLNISYCSETYAGSNDTGMQFDVSGSAAGGVNTAYVDEMTYNAATCGPAPNYCSTTSTANPGTTSALFTGTTGVNSTAFDTTYNPSPLDCYTRATDSSTFGGKSVGNNTYSGGDNDIMWSKNSDFVGTTTGGFVYILYLNVSGNCAQVINTGNITGSGGISGPGPFAFSKVTDNVFWNLIGYTQIQKNVITVPYNKTVTQTTIADVANGTTCPGLPFPFGATWSGILGIKDDDSRFGIVLSNAGGQGTGTWAVIYDTTLGCAVENTSTGSYWAFCTSSCTPSTSPTGTLSTAATCTNGTNCSCWGGGIHDAQFSGDGNSLVISENQGTAWTQGACAGTSSGTQFSIWNVGTQYTQWCGTNSTGSGGLKCGGHDSVGTSKIINSLSGDVASFRSLSNVLTYTQYATGPAWAAHGYWPQPDQSDDYPYVQTSYGLLSSGQDSGCGNPNACPVAGGNAIFADYPGNPGAYPPGQARTYFGHTYSCNDSGDTAYAGCPYGTGDYEFGCQYSIMSVSQDGNWAMIASGMLLGLGTDSLGNPRCDTFIVHLGAALSTPPTLTVTVVGSGTVTDNHSEISCPSVCTGTYVAGTVVTLTATPSIGYVFAGWSGACSGGGSCAITISSSEGVTAVFAPVLPPNGITIQNGVTFSQGVIIQ